MATGAGALAGVSAAAGSFVAGAAGSEAVVAGAVDVDGAVVVSVVVAAELPPLAARTACWQEADRLATFFSRHCSASEPPVGTLEQ